MFSVSYNETINETESENTDYNERKSDCASVATLNKLIEMSKVCKPKCLKSNAKYWQNHKQFKAIFFDFKNKGSTPAVQ